MKITKINTRRNMALIAGFSLLVMALLAGFGYGYAFQHIYVPQDSMATVINLNHSKFLFKVFIICFLISLVLDVVVSLALYGFFKKVNTRLSKLTAGLRLLYSVLFGVSIMSLLEVLPLLDRSPQNEELIMGCLLAFLNWWSWALLIIGFHLLGVGYLMLQATFIPKILGFLMLLAGLCYLFSNLANQFIPGYESYKPTVELIVSAPMTLGELGVAIWLIWKGGRQKNLFILPNSLSNPAK